MVCNICESEFNPSSRHKTFPSCRHKNKRLPCPVCGKLMYADSNTCNDCRINHGPFGGNWKGGKTTHKRGYVMRHIPAHPRASNGYVFEHILVMEDHLGRRLLPDENIHHKNGVRDDNRIENLELWSTHQPSGQRVEDKLAWAKEIIRRYG